MNYLFNRCPELGQNHVRASTCCEGLFLASDSTEFQNGLMEPIYRPYRQYIACPIFPRLCGFVLAKSTCFLYQHRRYISPYSCDISAYANILNMLLHTFSTLEVCLNNFDWVIQDPNSLGKVLDFLGLFFINLFI